MRRLFVAAAIAVTQLAVPASAQTDIQGYTVDELIDSDFIEETRAWLEVPVVRLTVESRNAEAGGMDQAEIDRLDQQWRAERGTEDQPLITSVLANPLSSYLIRIQANGVGLYSEIFVFDKNGLNAGQSAITSDYWQGDEAKFKKTYGQGADAIFISEPAFKDDTATWRSQLNMTVHDAAGKAIGAATVEVNLTELARRLNARDQQDGEG